MKKLLSLLLTAVLISVSLPIVSMAESTEISADILAYDQFTEDDLSGSTVILNTNDTHGSLEGFACVAGLEDHYREMGADVIITDAGDFSQGSSYVSMSKGADAVTVMNKAGYDFVSFGNHEFDYGYDQLLSNMSTAGFRTLCSNVYDKNTGKPLGSSGEIYETSSGIKIGFIGLLTPSTQTVSNPKYISGLRFDTGDAFFSDVKASTDSLKKQGAQIIVAVTHLGIEDMSAPYTSYDIADRTDGIDIIIDGHSHTVMTAVRDRTRIISTGTKFQYIGMTVIDDKGHISDQGLIPVDDRLVRDPEVSSLVDDITSDIDKRYSYVIGKTEVFLNGEKTPGVRDSETNLGDLCADSMLYAVKSSGFDMSSADGVFALVNGGGIRQSLRPGDITMNDLHSVMPFGNTVCVSYITGSQLAEMLECSTGAAPDIPIGAFPQLSSGIEISVDTSKPYDPQPVTYPGSTYYPPASVSRLTIRSINSREFRKDGTYAVITNSFNAAGGDTYYILTQASASYDTGIAEDEALIAYVNDVYGGVIGSEYADPAGRIQLLYGSSDRMFTDVDPDAYYYEAVNTYGKEGILMGTGEGLFTPDRDVSCAELYTMLYRIFGQDPAYESENDQTDGGGYYMPAFRWAGSLGFLHEDLSPEKALTRGEIILILYECRTALDLPDPQKGSLQTEILSDMSGLSGNLADAAEWCVRTGVIRGIDGKLMLSQKTTRAQMAAILYRTEKAA